MALDVLITPADGAIEFKNNGTVDYHLKNDNGNLHFGGADVVKSTTLVVSGKDNKSLHFDGTNDSAYATTAITDSMPSGTLPRSIEALIKLNGQGSNDGGVIAIWGDNNNGSNFGLGLDTSSVALIYVLLERAMITIPEQVLI